MKRTVPNFRLLEAAEQSHAALMRVGSTRLFNLRGKNFDPQRTIPWSTSPAPHTESRQPEAGGWRVGHLMWRPTRTCLLLLPPALHTWRKTCRFGPLIYEGSMLILWERRKDVLDWIFDSHPREGRASPFCSFTNLSICLPKASTLHPSKKSS